MDRAIKIFLAIIFFICLADMPYGYFQFVRFMAIVGFAVLTYLASEKENKIEMIVYIALIVLFQPFFKIALGRMLWNIVDGIVGIGLIISSFLPSKKKE